MIDTGQNRIDLKEAGQQACIARGGKGGRGNWQFRSPSNTTPMEAEDGVKGEEFELTLELKLLADVALIGLPNAGKSTLLSVLTKAKPKIANYPFTTLEPNLGVMEALDKKARGKALVIADVPGLIEGASEGKGLGINFLRHIERCQVLVHVLDGSILIENPKDGVEELLKDYQVIRKELSDHSEKLIEKEELIVLNKIDTLNEDQTKQLVRTLKKTKRKVILVSGVTGENLKELNRAMFKFF